MASSSLCYSADIRVIDLLVNVWGIYNAMPNILGSSQIHDDFLVPLPLSSIPPLSICPCPRPANQQSLRLIMGQGIDSGTGQLNKSQRSINRKPFNYHRLHWIVGIIDTCQEPGCSPPTAAYNLSCEWGWLSIPVAECHSFAGTSSSYSRTRSSDQPLPGQGIKKFSSNWDN